MTILRLFGIGLRLHPGFLLLLLAAGYVHMLTEALILFGTVLYHECAHAAVANAVGLEVTEIELLPFGGVAHIQDLMQLDPATEIKVAAAGPLANFLAVALLAWLNTALPAPVPHVELAQKINGWIGVFNLVPALPLDGGRIVRAWLSRRWGFRRATIAAVRGGQTIAVGLVAGALVMGLRGQIHLSLIAVAAFLFIAARNEKKAVAYVMIRYLTRKRRSLSSPGCLPARHLVAGEDTPVKEVVHRLTPDQFHLLWVIGPRGDIRRIVVEGEIIDAILERGNDTLVGELGRPF